MTDCITEAVDRLLALHAGEHLPPQEWRARSIIFDPEGD